MDDKQAYNVIIFIKNISHNLSEKAVYGFRPDPKDNYIFDLAVQNNCSFIVSDDALLLQFKLKPVQVYTSKWFLKAFLHNDLVLLAPAEEYPIGGRGVALVYRISLLGFS